MTACLIVHVKLTFLLLFPFFFFFYQFSMLAFTVFCYLTPLSSSFQHLLILYHVTALYIFFCCCLFLFFLFYFDLIQQTTGFGFYFPLSLSPYISCLFPVFSDQLSWRRWGSARVCGCRICSWTCETSSGPEMTCASGVLKEPRALRPASCSSSRGIMTRWPQLHNGQLFILFFFFASTLAFLDLEGLIQHKLTILS